MIDIFFMTSRDSILSWSKLRSQILETYVDFSPFMTSASLRGQINNHYSRDGIPEIRFSNLFKNNLIDVDSFFEIFSWKSSSYYKKRLEVHIYRAMCLVHAFNLERWFLRKNSSIYVLLGLVEDFFITIRPELTNNTIHIVNRKFGLALRKYIFQIFLPKRLKDWLDSRYR